MKKWIYIAAPYLVILFMVFTANKAEKKAEIKGYDEGYESRLNEVQRLSDEIWELKVENDELTGRIKVLNKKLALSKTKKPDNQHVSLRKSLNNPETCSHKWVKAEMMEGEGVQICDSCHIFRVLKAK